jgi:hypothetical protein
MNNLEGLRKPDEVHFLGFRPLFSSLTGAAWLFQEPTDRCLDVLSGPFAAHEDVRIVGVADESVASPCQFLIQLIELFPVRAAIHWSLANVRKSIL